MTHLTGNTNLLHLSRAEARLGAMLRRPKIIAVTCILTLTGLGWAYLAMLATGAGGGDRDFLSAICRTTFDATQQGWGGRNLALAWLMWCAMALAMMLPTAGPMILTYAEIADTAARKGESAVSPFVLAAGYVAIWFGFALAATVVQAGLARIAPLMSGLEPAVLSGMIFLAAGLYQFSAVKQACLAVCQHPFPFLFANWSSSPGGVFHLGLRQGLHCLGCCWALMLVMLAVGVMNVLWMACLGLLMAAEKLTTTPRFSRAVGIAFVSIGLAFIAASVREHWIAPPA